MSCEAGKRLSLLLCDRREEPNSSPGVAAGVGGARSRPALLVTHSGAWQSLSHLPGSFPHPCRVGLLSKLRLPQRAECPGGCFGPASRGLGPGGTGLGWAGVGRAGPQRH